MQLENIKLNLDTKIVLNIGDPINKTNAPRAYNKLFSILDMNAIMLPAQIGKGELGDFMDACRTLNIRYFSPTMPHKKDIIQYLDNVDESSRIFGSVNAVRIDEDGISHGVGMDGKGVAGALSDAGVGIAGKRVMMLGSGGICGVIGLELSRNGASSLAILNRTADKAAAIAEILNRETPMPTTAARADKKELDRAAENADLLIQATPLGMAGYPHTHPYLGFIDRLPKTAAVFDAIINPPDTPVIAAAKERGLATVPGMNMLAAQMAAIFKFMFNVELTQAHKAACIDELKEFLGIGEASVIPARV